MLIGNKQQHDNTSSINKTSTSKQNNNNDEFDEKAANISDVVLDEAKEINNKTIKLQKMIDDDAIKRGNAT